MHVLQVRDLVVSYGISDRELRAVNKVSLDIAESESVGLCGESGSGKSTLALSLMRLLPINAKILEGEVVLNGENILLKDEKEMEKIRGKVCSIVFQGALNALNPVYRISDQISEAILQHKNLSKQDAEKQVKELSLLVNLDPQRLRSYPHELSGGMKQRVLIATALSCEPDLVIMDEPVTALDVMTQSRILEEIKRLKSELHQSILFISHDINTMAEFCDRIFIMYAGRILEHADTKTIFNNPRHPYTSGLLKSLFMDTKGTLYSIPGEPPNLMNLPSGCPFHPRCRYKLSICEAELPEIVETDKNHFVRCHVFGKPS
jgi:oligopeptide/dipeptide ABC transporter ATP-binding protein